ncbi:MAG: class I adenylate-forming enzyme family protein [Acidimicrobiaceae bacterium]|nr:class I adenylate-forming enzyme family protein [Acidimicrobiaceae bacterium]
MNIVSLLEKTADALGGRSAIGSRDCGFTYHRLWKDAALLARHIQDYKSKYLLVCDENSRALTVALFAAAWAGVAYVPLNYRLTNRELCSLVADTTPALALVGANHKDRLNLGENPQKLLMMKRSEVLNIAGDNCSSVEMEGWSIDPEMAAVLIHTSGTSGTPKSVLLRHKHLVAYVTGTKEFASASNDEVHVLAVPPYHVASISAQLSQVYEGRRMVMLPQFDAKLWIELVKTENATHVMLVPTMMSRIVAALEDRGEQLTSIRSVSYGGGKPHRKTVLRALELMPNADFFHAYGLTETSSTVAMLDPIIHRKALAGDALATKRLDSVGHPLPVLEVAIRNRRTNNSASKTAPASVNDTSENRIGEIWVRGAHVSGEYRETGSALDSEGWFHTNDIGYFDRDGYLYLLGRSDDMIIRGGVNVSPTEIEEILISHPRITDAAVFGIASPEWGEEIAAAVVVTPPLPTTEQLQKWAKKRLRSHRTPSRFVFVDKLPYNQTGKLLRHYLKKRFAAEMKSTLRKPV